MPSNDSNLIEAQHIGRRHPSHASWLLEDVSLTVQEGMRLAVVGPSGSGKTLLLRAMAMLDPIDHGHLLWRGEHPSRDAIPAFRAQVTYVHQRSALFEDTVEGALRQPFTLRVDRGRRFDRDRAVGLLAQLGRDAAFLDKRIRDLSGGEMQIVALARVLQLDPTVLLLDEPTAALDDATTRLAEALLTRWIETLQTTRAWVWVTHDTDQARRLATHTIAIEGGKVVSRAP